MSFECMRIFHMLLNFKPGTVETNLSIMGAVLTFNPHVGRGCCF